MSVVETDARTAHSAGVERLLASYRAIPPNATVRLAKPTSNLFRARAKTSTKGLDVSGLAGVIAVDPDNRTADVAGMCTYEDLVAATLPYGLAPLVVPQLKTITLGGAVTGLGIESTSFRNGLPHESVLEMDILTGTGEVLTASPTMRTPISFGLPQFLWHAWIFGSDKDRAGAGETVRRDSPSAVQLADGTFRDDGPHHRNRRSRRCARRLPRRRGVLGRRELSDAGIPDATPGPVSDYTGQQIYYRSIQHPGDNGAEKHDRLTIHDYLWRWDTDWFWCSRAFGAQDPRIRRFWPRRYRRSAFYWKLIGYDQRFNIADRIEKRNGRPPLERVVQDIEVPIGRAAEFLSTGSWTTCPSSRSGCARCGSARTPPGRCTRSAPTTPTSTSASGRPCQSAQPKATPTS